MKRKREDEPVDEDRARQSDEGHRQTEESHPKTGRNEVVSRVSSRRKKGRLELTKASSRWEPAGKREVSDAVSKQLNEERLDLHDTFPLA